VIAADALIGMPETRIGLIPDVGGSSRLPQVVGLGRAKELVMTGKLIGGEEAERIGLANRVAPAEELAAATQTLVDELLACAPVAVGLAKRVMDASARPALSTTLELEVVMQERCAATADFAEGATAFREKRPPSFSGR
jgi:enoyl-CoA hydratase/carnithine racemase